MNSLVTCYVAVSFKIKTFCLGGEFKTHDVKGELKQQGVLRGGETFHPAEMLIKHRK